MQCGALRRRHTDASEPTVAMMPSHDLCISHRGVLKDRVCGSLILPVKFCMRSDLIFAMATTSEKAGANFAVQTKKLDLKVAGVQYKVKLPRLVNTRLVAADAHGAEGQAHTGAHGRACRAGRQEGKDASDMHTLRARVSELRLGHL